MVGWTAVGWLVLGWNAVAPASAEEGAKCAGGPRSAWMSEAELRNRAANLGLSIDIFRISKGGCYEFHGREAEKWIEVHVDPITGDMVHKSP